MSAIGAVVVQAMEVSPQGFFLPTRVCVGNCLRLASLAAALAVLPIAAAQSGPSPANDSLPDAPAAAVAIAATPQSQSTPPAPAQQTPPATQPPSTQAPDAAAPPQTGSGIAPELKDQKDLGAQQIKKQEQQRILGIIPAFNSVYEGRVPPLTPGQKFRLMFKSTTDVYVFGFAAFTAGIGQAQNSHAGYGQGAEGYFKRFGANYADTADGNFWGNAVLPVVLHQDPRYFRLGHGSYLHRILYSASTAFVCKGDNGKWQPNVSNVLGNFIGGGISNLYYPEADRGVEQTVQSALTVTAEGMIGSQLIEFWPDVTQHYHLKRQARRDAAAAAAAKAAQTANPSGLPPQ